MKLPSLPSLPLGRAELLACGAATLVVGGALCHFYFSREGALSAAQQAVYAACSEGVARLAPSAASAASATLSHSLSSDPVVVACAAEGSGAPQRAAACERMCGALLRAACPAAQGLVVLSAPQQGAVALWAPPRCEGPSTAALLWRGGYSAAQALTGWARRGRAGAYLSAAAARRRACPALAAPQGYWYLALSGARPGADSEQLLLSVLEPVFAVVRGRAASALPLCFMPPCLNPIPPPPLPPLFFPCLRVPGGQGGPALLHRGGG